MPTGEELVQYGVGGGLAYLMVRLVLDFLVQWRDARRECIEQEQWQSFLVQFQQHHTEDKQLLQVTESLNEAIRGQTAIFATLTANIEAQSNMLTQISMDIRHQRRD